MDVMEKDVITIIISILVPMFSGFLWIINRMYKKFEAIDKKLESVNNRIDVLSDKINDLDKRLSRIEGIIYWLEKFFFNKNGTENK